jgi:hypothetical protein
MKNKNIFLGMILVIIGGLWLLNNLDIFDFSVRYLFNSFWKLWPLIIVVVGTGLILNNKTAERILWLIFFLVVLGYAIFMQYGNPFTNNIDGNITKNNKNSEDRQYYPLNSLDQNGNLVMNIGATKFKVSSTDSDNFFESDSNIRNLTIDVTESGTITTANIKNSGDLMDLNGVSDNSLDLRLNNKIPWDIKVNCGAVDGNLDLSAIESKNVAISIGAGKLDLILSEIPEIQIVNLNAGVSEIEIGLPETSGLKINFKGALNSTNIDTLGLTKQDNTYISENYDTASKKIDMDIEIGLGKLDFEYK